MSQFSIGFVRTLMDDMVAHQKLPPSRFPARLHVSRTWDDPLALWDFQQMRPHHCARYLGWTTAASGPVDLDRPEHDPGRV